MKVLIVIQHRFELWTPPPWFLERLRADFPEVIFEHCRNYAQAEPHIGDADVMVTWSLRPEQLARAQRLRWIHSTAAAVHGLMTPELVRSNVVVTNASSVHGPAVGEHAFALMLALARHLPSAFRYQQQHIWGQEPMWKEHPQLRELAGATLGLRGVGAIGREVARRSLVSGMRLIALREHPERGIDFLRDGADASAVKVAAFDQIEAVLPEADFVVLAAPLTEKTRTLINRQRLALMKPEAYLINVSRGALVDEAALVEALRNNRIGGAALDVFDQEPLPAASPLWDLENVIITPHSAGSSSRMWERHYALFSENLRRFIASQPLMAVVDKTKGY
jgi:phosphoglycerate dehydrogenase-like enzyme